MFSESWPKSSLRIRAARLRPPGFACLFWGKQWMAGCALVAVPLFCGRQRAPPGRPDGSKVYDLGNENLFVEVTNPLVGKFGQGMSIYAIAHFIGASQRDVRRALIQGTTPLPALSVEAGAKLLTHNTYQGG
jgi:hypothetical protein